jgi:hypothetical protein
MNFILKKFDEFTANTKQEIGLIHQRLSSLETNVAQLRSQPAPAPLTVVAEKRNIKQKFFLLVYI